MKFNEKSVPRGDAKWIGNEPHLVTETRDRVPCRGRERERKRERERECYDPPLGAWKDLPHNRYRAMDGNAYGSGTVMENCQNTEKRPCLCIFQYFSFPDINRDPLYYLLIVCLFSKCKSKRRVSMALPALPMFPVNP